MNTTTVKDNCKLISKNYTTCSLTQGGTVEYIFRGIVTAIGCQARGDHPAPRIHDLRHTFAVRRLQTWRNQHQCIDQALFWLCTYLGHAKISDTYWYLTGVPELMDSIGARLEQFAVGSTQS